MTPEGVTKYYGNYEYFQQKRLEEQLKKEEQVPERMEKPPATASAASAAPPVNRKQRKREEAMIRNEIGKLKKPQEAIVEDSEAQMEALDQEQKDIYQALAEAKPETDFAALNRRLNEIKREMEQQATRWEQAAEKLERLSAECEARIAEL